MASGSRPHNVVATLLRASTHASAVPYREALRPGAPYTAGNLEQDLRSVVDRVRPTWVLAPTSLDALRLSSRVSAG